MRFTTLVAAVVLLATLAALAASWLRRTFVAVEVVKRVEVDPVGGVRKQRGEAFFLWRHPESRSACRLAFFDDSVFEAFAATVQRLVDRFR